MTTDERKSREPLSGSVEVASGNQGPISVLVLAGEEELSVEYLKAEYPDDATTNTRVEFYDSDGTDTLGDLTDPIDVVPLVPGDRFQPEGVVYDDIEEGVVVVTDGNGDDSIPVTVGGYVVDR